MSYNLHIPIDDISEADLEADLEEAAQLSKPYNPQAESLADRHPEFQTSLKAYPVPVAVGGYPSRGDHWDKDITPSTGGAGSGGGGGNTWDGKTVLESVGGSGDDAKLSRVSAGKQVSNLELALARDEIQASRDKLLEDRMREEQRGDASAPSGDKQDGDAEKALPFLLPQTKFKQAGVETSKSDADVAQKRIFVNALKKKQNKKLLESITTTPPPSKDLMKLMSDLKSISTEDDAGEQAAADLKDFADETKIKKYKNIPLKNSDNDQEEDRAYKEKASSDRKKVLPDGETSQIETKDRKGQNANLNDGGAVVGKNAEVILKNKKKGKHHKKHKGIYDKKTQLDNDAVEMMIAMDRQTNKNQTGHFHFVNSGTDVVDLQLSDSDRAWTHGIHGRRDIVAAGAIVMCLGIIVILVSLINLVRRRFIKSARNKRNRNNNRRYRSLGSASETEILRKPQKSLFPAAASDDDQDDGDDDGDDSSTSGEEIVFHQGKIKRSF